MTSNAARYTAAVFEVNPFRTAVAFEAHTGQIISSLVRKNEPLEQLKGVLRLCRSFSNE